MLPGSCHKSSVWSGANTSSECGLCLVTHCASAHGIIMVAGGGAAPGYMVILEAEAVSS